MSLAAALLVRAKTTKPDTGRSKRCTTPRNTAPGFWYVYPTQAFNGRVADLAVDGVTVELFRLLGEAITSHCMVAYEAWEHTSPLHTVTEQSTSASSGHSPQ